MKMKKKGKVYPSPPPSSSSSSSSHYEDDSLSVLRLLPATILVLVSVLSVEDREVLAYLITRGTSISAIGSCGRSSSSSSPVDSKKKKNKNHKPPVFDCECFECYTNYWFRWDSSPNRELIDEIIEAFENHQITSNGENSVSRNKSKKGKKKEKPEPMIQTTVAESHVSPSPGRLIEAEVTEEEESKLDLPVAATTVHKGLARKVLPDVLGLFNSNFWRLWNPNA